MRILRTLLFAAACFACAATAAVAVPLGTGFTYQGRLEQGGSPFAGTAHFRFSLWDASAGGTQVGTSQIAANVVVAGGDFTVQLNSAGQFGATAFDGDGRWLQIEVCTDASCTTPTLLSPRQPVTSAPYALKSVETQKLTNVVGGHAVDIQPGTATNIPGMYAGKVPGDLLLGSMVEDGYTHGYLSLGYPNGDRKFSIGRASSTDFNSATFLPQFTVVPRTGNVGIGTTAPEFPLSFASQLGNKISLYTPNSGGRYGFGIQPDLLQMFSETSGSDIAFGYGTSDAFTERMRIKGNGNVGIGTSAPLAKLEVRGNIRMGSTGTEFAAGGVENLRILRGALNGAGTGTIQYGAGFTIATEGNFIRKITFNTPFLSPPAVTATSNDCTGCFVRMCEILEVTSSYVRVAEYNRHDGSYSGGPFNFIAIGPR
jgi:hypothetical protein